MRKNTHTLELVGYSTGYLMMYLEAKFTEGMALDNMVLVTLTILSRALRSIFYPKKNKKMFSLY